VNESKGLFMHFRLDSTRLRYEGYFTNGKFNGQGCLFSKQVYRGKF